MTSKETALATINSSGNLVNAWIPRDIVGPRYHAGFVLGFAQQQIAKLYDANQRSRKRDQHVKELKIVPASITSALVTFAMAGIMPNAALGLGYLVPYEAGNSGWSVITPIFGYKGLKELALRTGRVLSIETRLIYRDAPLDREVPVVDAVRRYLPPPTRSTSSKDYEAVDYACSLAQCWHEGTIYWQAHVMPKAQIEQVRATSKAGNSGPWKDHPGRMAEKTAVRRQVTAGEIPVDYVVGLASAAEAAAEARNYQAQRDAFEAMAAMRDVPAEAVQEAVDSVAEADTPPRTRRRTISEHLRPAKPAVPPVATHEATGIRFFDWMERDGHLHGQWRIEGEMEGTVTVELATGEIVDFTPPEAPSHQLGEAVQWALGQKNKA